MHSWGYPLWTVAMRLPPAVRWLLFDGDEVLAYEGQVTSGLLRLIPASEAADLRRQHREDFQLRFYRLTGHPLSVDDAWRWWPS